jgi:nicotinamide-nucleotide amidase
MNSHDNVILRFSILSTGTELTTGQIINKNSAWISSQLKTLGLTAPVHLTVPDDRQLMREALQFCLERTEVLIITGGLGPTSDDFTREIVSEYLNLDLEFNADSWKRIQELLQKRGVTPKDIQKQQSYFPKTAEILMNSQGTADGFKIIKVGPQQNKAIIVLPGPPHELAALWNDHVKDWIQQIGQYVDKIKMYSWDTLGLGESEVAEIVINTLKDMKKDFPMEIGYRAHLPYIEVKLSYPESIDHTAQIYKNKIDHALSSITVLKNFDNASQVFFNILGSTPFAFYDFVTDGSLHKSLSESLNETQNWLWKQVSSQTTESFEADFFQEEENFISLTPVNEKSIYFQADLNGKKHSRVLECPDRLVNMPRRKQMYFAELALIEFIRNFRR